MRARLVACLVSLVIPSCGLLAALRGGDSIGQEMDLSRIPGALGAWSVGQEDRLSLEAEQMLEPDGYVFRRYDREGEAPIWLYVGLYSKSNGFGTGAHTPDACYPAQGFEVTAQQSVSVTVAPGQVMRARLLRTERRERTEYVLYWFQPAARWPMAEGVEQVLRVWDAISGSPRYAFVRLSVAFEARQGQRPDSSEQVLSEFGARVAPHIRAALNPITGR